MNSTLTQKQGILLIVMFIIGSSVLMVMGMEAQKDIWAAIILGMAASAIVMLIYVRISTALPDKDFFETMEYFLGKVGGKIVIFLITWFSFDLCAIVLRNYGQFVITVGLKETPLVVIMSVMILVCAIAVYYGISTMSRWNEMFVFLVIGFIAVTVVLVAKNMEINNLLPSFDEGFKPILEGAFGVSAFPFVETVVFLLIFPAFGAEVSAEKVYLKGLLFGGIIIFVTSVTDILVLGSQMAEGMYYPTYSALSTIHLGDFIYRLEAIAAIVFVISVFLKISLLLYGACNGTARLFNIKDNRFIIIPISFLVVFTAVNSFDNMLYYQQWVSKVFRYYAAPFEFIVPLVVYIIIEIKLRNKQPSTQ